ncbi:MAG: FG-GAP repeat protein [Blastocatellia bacterium]|nr:FG-GAP repeat protein [Blastocatellia bacterium]
MKRGIPIILTTLGLLLSLGLLRLWLPAATTGGPWPALQGEAALNHIKGQGEYGSLQEAVTAARYGFHQYPKGKDDWLANNPAQRLNARLTTGGLDIATEGDEGRGRRLGMKLCSAGYGERQMATKTGRLIADGARAEIHHELPQSQITEWYNNTAAGLEQGFTIESAPGERRDGERLRVELALEGELKTEASPDGKALEFRDVTGRPALRYDHLVVRDGAGRELEASMAVRLKEGKVWLEVDDRNAVWPVTIDPTFTQRQKLEASDAVIGDRFGYSVAISGDTVVVGAVLDDDAAGSDQGSAYVFVRGSDGTWTQQQKLEASDAASDDQFGNSVAISGETIVVGVRLKAGALGPQQGAVYVFTRSGAVWTQQQKLEAPDSHVFDNFGASVAISGETIVVGDTLADGPAGMDQGAAYVFARGGSGVWTLLQKLEALDALGTPAPYFGESVAINGETIVVGAPNWYGGTENYGQGAAYVFVDNGGVWSQQQQLVASDPGPFELFGQSVAIDGETVVIGASYGAGAVDPQQGTAYVFTRRGGVWSEQQKLEAPDAEANVNFGESVAISGETIVVGAFLATGVTGSQQGSAYLFTRSGSVWNEQQELEASPAKIGAHFGSAVAISGNTVVVGAESDAGHAAPFAQGAAYIFTPPNTPPAITTFNVSRTQCADASTASLGTVNDTEDPRNTLTVTINGAASATVNGVTVSSIGVNSEGLITATMRAECDASNASFTLRVMDSGGLFAEATLNVTVNYNFSSFFQPVDNPPTVNQVNAGRAIPIIFSLSGDKSLNIFAAGFPVSEQIACTDGAPSSKIEQTTTAGGSSLSYDAVSDTYTYVWKTEESWAGTCRQLIVRLNDGSERVASFKFK